MQSNQPDDIQAVCMCGWPQHMLLPKGTADGYPFRLFVMISDYKDDKVGISFIHHICMQFVCKLWFHREKKVPTQRCAKYPIKICISKDRTTSIEWHLQR